MQSLIRLERWRFVQILFQWSLFDRQVCIAWLIFGNVGAANPSGITPALTEACEKYEFVKLESDTMGAKRSIRRLAYPKA